MNKMTLIKVHFDWLRAKKTKTKKQHKVAVEQKQTLSKIIS